MADGTTYHIAWCEPEWAVWWPLRPFVTLQPARYNREYRDIGHQGYMPPNLKCV